MTVEPAIIMAKLKEFIIENSTDSNKSDLNQNLMDGVDFIGAGYVDSLLFVDLIEFIDETFNISVDLGKIEREAMKSFLGFCTAVARQSR